MGKIMASSVAKRELPCISLVFGKAAVKATASKSNGFSFSTLASIGGLRMSCLKCSAGRIGIVPNGAGGLGVGLTPGKVALGRIIMGPGGRGCDGGRGPTIGFMGRIVTSQRDGSPHGRSCFRCSRCRGVIFTVGSCRPGPGGGKGPNGFSFLVSFISALSINAAVLPISRGRGIRSICCHGRPGSRGHVIGKGGSSNISRVFSHSNVRRFLGRIFQRISVFGGSVPLFLREFIDPLSAVKPGCCGCCLLSALGIGKRGYISLKFIPFGSRAFNFANRLFIALSSAFFMRGTVLGIPGSVGLGFISKVAVRRAFRHAPSDAQVVAGSSVGIGFGLDRGSGNVCTQQLGVCDGRSFSRPSTRQTLIFGRDTPIVALGSTCRRSRSF